MLPLSAIALTYSRSLHYFACLVVVLLKALRNAVVLFSRYPWTISQSPLRHLLHNYPQHPQ